MKMVKKGIDSEKGAVGQLLPMLMVESQLMDADTGCRVGRVVEVGVRCC